MRSTLFRFLTRYTSDNLQRLVEVVPGDNGWEAWRQLELHCEPSVGMREAQVMATFNNMIMSIAKSPKESRLALADIDQKANRVAEITGK